MNLQGVARRIVEGREKAKNVGTAKMRSKASTEHGHGRTAQVHVGAFEESARGRGAR